MRYLQHDKLDRYLVANAGNAIINKAKNIVRWGKYIAVDLNLEDGGKAKYRVRSEQYSNIYYDVVLQNFLGPGSMSGTCTCAYGRNYGGLCKHIGAMMMVLDGHEALAEPAGAGDAASHSRDISRIVDGSQAILEKLPAKARGEILALAGEDHYVRVITNRGSGLVYGRLSVIAASMPPEWGLQVHRSNWVSRTAVVKLVNTSGKYRAVLADGSEIPVSARYVELLRRLVA